MICPDCKGSGSITMFVTTKPCATCKGTGNVADEPSEPKSLSTLFGFPIMEAKEPIGPKGPIVFGHFPPPITGTAELAPDPLLAPLPGPILATSMGTAEAERMRKAWRESLSGARRGCIVPAPDPTLGVAASASSPARVSLDISLECDADNADTLIKMLKGPRFVLHGMQRRTMARWTPPAEPSEPATERTATMTMTTDMVIHLLGDRDPSCENLCIAMMLPADLTLEGMDFDDALRTIYVFTLRGPSLPAGASRVKAVYAMRGGKRVFDRFDVVA